MVLSARSRRFGRRPSSVAARWAASASTTSLRASRSIDDPAGGAGFKGRRETNDADQSGCEDLLDSRVLHGHVHGRLQATNRVR